MTEQEIIQKHQEAGNKVVNIVYNLAVPFLEAAESLYTMLQMNREMHALKAQKEKEAPKPAVAPEPVAHQPA